MGLSLCVLVFVAAPKRRIEKTKASPAPKKQKRAAVDSDEDDEEVEDAKSSPVVPARRPTRTKARITYKEMSSDEEEEEEEHASSGVSEADDNESDFE